jgi:hypothetical protein
MNSINSMLMQNKVYQVQDLIHNIKILNKISEFSEHFSTWLLIASMIVSTGTGYFGYTLLSYLSSTLSAVSLGFSRYSTYTRGVMKANYKKLRVFDTGHILIPDDDSSDLGYQIRDTVTRDNQITTDKILPLNKINSIELATINTL